MGRGSRRDVFAPLAGRMWPAQFAADARTDDLSNWFTKGMRSDSLEATIQTSTSTGKFVSELTAGATNG
jgi:hypothetical protein